jgi:hypothetical protein
MVQQKLAGEGVSSYSTPLPAYFPTSPTNMLSLCTSKVPHTPEMKHAYASLGMESGKSTYQHCNMCRKHTHKCEEGAPQFDSLPDSWFAFSVLQLVRSVL